MENVIKGVRDARRYLEDREWVDKSVGVHIDALNDALAMLKEQETMMQCIKGKCRICPHCANCDVDENGLLKEQESAKPELTEHIVFGTNRKCSNCGKYLFPACKFCPHCGKSVKWNE